MKWFFVCLIILPLLLGVYDARRPQAPTMPELQANADLAQERLEARLTGLMRYCIRGDRLERFKPGCEELAQYVIQQAEQTDREIASREKHD